MRVETYQQGEGIIKFIVLGGNTIEILDIYVKESRRRKGVGTRLVNRVVEEYPTHSIYLHTRESNKDAQSFYVSLGFYRITNIGNLYTEDDKPETATLMLRRGKR